MPLHDACAFCLKLPVTAHRSGKITRCPLCRSTLIETGSGITHRFDESNAPARRSGRGYLWIAGGATLLLAVWLGTQLLHSSPSAKSAPTVPSVSPNTPRTVAQARSAAEAVTPTPARAATSEATMQAAPRIAFVEEKSKAPARVKDTARSTNFVSGRAKVYAVPQRPEPAPVQLTLTHWADLLPSPQAHRDMLLQVPEVRLKDIRPGLPRETLKQIVELAREIQMKNAKQPDGYVRELMEKRPDLAGLPFLLGTDCQLQQGQATKFGELTLLVREVLTSSIPSAQRSRTFRDRQSGQSSSGGSAVPSATTFWSSWSTGYMPRRGTARDLHRGDPEHVGALVQLLAPENEGFHRGLVDYLRDLKTKSATAALAREALFALDPETRLNAVHALRQRDAEDYTSLLVDGLRYPWGPVATHAAQALVQLGRTDLVPVLIDRLDAPDPCAPFETTLNEKTITAVRELVRIIIATACCATPP
jgi:hypothetical protein